VAVAVAVAGVVVTGVVVVGNLWIKLMTDPVGRGSVICRARPAAANQEHSTPLFESIRPPGADDVHVLMNITDLVTVAGAREPLFRLARGPRIPGEAKARPQECKPQDSL
jgi:hypothetical protein